MNLHWIRNYTEGFLGYAIYLTKTETGYEYTGWYEKMRKTFILVFGECFNV
jgi:hypothetical protein